MNPCVQKQKIRSRPGAFKAYVDLGLTQSDEDVALFSTCESEFSSISLMPSLLPGEVVIAQAENVLKFDTMSELKKGISGGLVCTNFKLSFRTTEEFQTTCFQTHLLLGENDICLINIDSVYQGNGGRKKKLLLGALSAHSEIIEIVCKDFRIYTFSFKFSPAEHSKIITSAILHHAFVPRLQLLFAFDYKEHASGDDHKRFISLAFDSFEDWEKELKHSGCPGWKVTQANEGYLLCNSLPQCFVVPNSLFDADLNIAAPHFIGHRVPRWSWGFPSGVVLIRMAALDPAISDSKEQENMLRAVREACARQHDVRIIDVEEHCPSVKEIQTSFLKLRDLCTPATTHEFWEQDSHYLSNLESTGWLHHISTSLDLSLRLAVKLRSEKESVVLKEKEDRDLNCLISSLIQVILDAYCRTQEGFQNLIQKEWVALGHPFTERLRHISGYENEESPVFLLFLDCIWQLTQQCPTLFEFSETYLTALWDSTHISIFDTFLFSCQKSRMEELKKETGLILHNVWDWSKQFSHHDIYLFQNPLYILNKYKDLKVNYKEVLSRPYSFGSLRSKKNSNSKLRPLVLGSENISNADSILDIDPNIKALKLWNQCYLRWIPLSHIVGGGLGVSYINNLKIFEDIRTLEKIVISLSSRTKLNPSPRHRRVASDDYIFTEEVETCRMKDNPVVTSAFPFSPVGRWDWGSFHSVPSASCLQSYLSAEENFDE